MAMMKSVGSDMIVYLPVNALIGRDQNIVTQEQANVIIAKRQEVTKKTQEAVDLLLPEINKLVEEAITDIKELNLIKLKYIITTSFGRLSHASSNLYNSNLLGFDKNTTTSTTSDDIVFEIGCQYDYGTILKLKMINDSDLSLTDYRKKITSMVKNIMCTIGYKLTIGEAGKSAVVITPIPQSKAKKTNKKK